MWTGIRRSESQLFNYCHRQLCMLSISFACINALDYCHLRDRPVFSFLMHAGYWVCSANTCTMAIRTKLIFAHILRVSISHFFYFFSQLERICRLAFIEYIQTKTVMGHTMHFFLKIFQVTCICGFIYSVKLFIKLFSYLL